MFLVISCGLLSFRAKSRNLKARGKEHKHTYTCFQPCSSTCERTNSPKNVLSAMLRMLIAPFVQMAHDLPPSYSYCPVISICLLSFRAIPCFFVGDSSFGASLTCSWRRYSIHLAQVRFSAGDLRYKSGSYAFQRCRSPPFFHTCANKA